MREGRRGCIAVDLWGGELERLGEVMMCMYLWGEFAWLAGWLAGGIFEFMISCIAWILISSCVSSAMAFYRYSVKPY